MPDLYSTAILNALEELWDREEPQGHPGGDRIFVRYVHRDPVDPGWDDWRLVAIIPHYAPVLDWIVEHGPAVRGMISKALASGGLDGKITDSANHLIVWWCRSKFDGPDKRVTDWADPPGRR
jgi:hypothetical protein